ncbi:hypothetical protein [Methanofollis fontis]|uniref:Uncharacterized protein n=1 Tax=Methanofollis fontis TaxID=2052832 RepID=A0A483CQY9_9EURY|nr:hypothetical protein [Methanofollis fontis]TAJ44591.1 hypothetical protein CUJ86_04595 [Methanofollis fontis]
MERLHLLILAVGVVIGGALAITVDVFMGVSVAIIFGTIAMSLHIMNDTKNLPDISCRLTEDAKAVQLKNSGNAPAEGIHVALVPLNIEFDVPVLGVEEEYTHALPEMVERVKVVITYRNTEGGGFNRTLKLSSMDDDDPLKPAFPMFSWK